MAPRTERRFASNLKLDALPNSSANIFATREIWSLGGMISDIMPVPLLRAASKLLTSFLLFQISMFLSATLGSSAVFSLPSPSGPTLWWQRLLLPGGGSDVGHPAFSFYMSVPLVTFSSLVHDLKSIRVLKLPKTKKNSSKTKAKVVCSRTGRL